MPPKSRVSPRDNLCQHPLNRRMGSVQVQVPEGPEIKRPRAPARPRKATRPALNVAVATRPYRHGTRRLRHPGAHPADHRRDRDPSLGRMLSFALDQMRLQYRLLDSGSLTLRELLDMPVGSQRPLVVLDVDLPGVDGHAISTARRRPSRYVLILVCRRTPTNQCR